MSVGIGIAGLEFATPGCVTLGKVISNGPMFSSGKAGGEECLPH